MFCQSGDNTLKQYIGIYTARMKNTIMNQDLKKIEKEGWMQTYCTTLHAKHVVLILYQDKKVTYMQPGSPGKALTKAWIYTNTVSG